MFHGWDSFYLIVGSAAGALIGLLFVVVSLTAGFDSRVASHGAQLYMSPIVFHFAVIVVVSCIASIPEVPPEIVGIAVSALAAIGFVYSGLTGGRMLRAGLPVPPDLSDKIFYALFPSLLYLALGCGAAIVWFAAPSAAYIIGLTMLGQLLIGIRNAWDLVTYIVQHQQDPANRPKE